MSWLASVETSATVPSRTGTKSPPHVAGRGYLVFKERGPGMAGAGKKVVPPLRGRLGGNDEAGNADLPGFLRVWVAGEKCVEFWSARR